MTVALDVATPEFPEMHVRMFPPDMPKPQEVVAEATPVEAMNSDPPASDAAAKVVPSHRPSLCRFNPVVCLNAFPPSCRTPFAEFLLPHSCCRRRHAGG